MFLKITTDVLKRNFSGRVKYFFSIEYKDLNRICFGVPSQVMGCREPSSKHAPVLARWASLRLLSDVLCNVILCAVS